MSTIRPPRDLCPDPARDEAWKPYLEPDERLLWEGRPANGNRSCRDMLVLILTGVLLAGLCTIVAYLAIYSSSPGLDAGFAFLFSIIGAFVGLLLIVGGFLNPFRRRLTRYALTNRRALVSTSYRGRRTIQSYQIGPYTHVEHCAGGKVKVIFQRSIEVGEEGTITSDTGFDLIEDGSTVEGIIRKIKAGDYAR